MGLGGVTVRLSGMADAQTATDNSGQFAFTGLRSGTYSVEISGFDMDEVGFGSVSSSATIGVGESKILTFDGTYLRTAGIMGQVSVEGGGLAGVTVTMTGEGEDQTDITDAGGLYGFSKLKAGAYSVAISGYDPDQVEFGTTSMNVTIALGETANIPFEGTLLRTSGISGRVSTEGEGRDGVTVTLTGAAEATETTANGGQYAFAGLAEGTYVVTISGWDEVAYNFDENTTATIVLGDAMSHIENFEGTHTRSAGISGALFIDEVMKDGMLTAGEPTLSAALAPLVASGALDPVMLAGLLTQAKVELRGPDLNTVKYLDIDPLTSTFTSPGLVAGTYQVSLPVSDEMVAAVLAAAGVKSVGDAAVVTVGAGMQEPVNFPFEITMQTVATGARMGGGGHFGLPVEGVKLALYARADGTGMLDEQVTDGMGRATFNFARAEDTSPGSDKSDNIVFVKAVESGHPALVVSGNEIVEIAFASTARLYAADPEKEVATLLNVAVSFDFWVKSNETARTGDEGLGGWSTIVVMGDSEDALMMEDEDGEMVNATMPTNDGKMNEDYLGKSTFSYVVDPTMLPATFGVVAAPAGQPDMSEMWEQSDPLVHTHTGLDLPLGEDDDMIDLGPIRITFNTQTLRVGVYRETDDEPGFSNYQSKVAGGDQRPSDDVSEELMVELMKENSRGRLTRHEYKAFDTDGERTVEVTNPMPFAEGLASFKHLPADEEFTVRFHAGSDRKAVVDVGSSRNGRDVDTYGDDLEDGTSVGAFGDEGGAGPEVRLCPMSSSSMDDMCSTFGYQWASGSISGKVTRRGAGVSGAAVNLEAITNNHSPDDNKKTIRSGAYGFASVQDGEYWVRTPATATNKADSARIAIYHDEATDDDPDDGIIGTGVTATADFALTALRLDIKGYVANDGNEGNDAGGEFDGIVRGDEAVAGVEVALGTIARISANKKDTTFNWLQTVETNADGLYEFEDVTEGAAYVVRVLESADDNYTAGRSLGAKDDRTATGVASDEYPSVTAEGDFVLPRWDYLGNKIVSTTSSVEVSNATGTVKADLVNFALLYTDGSMSGRVREAASSPGNITIELARCDTYVSGDRCKTYDRGDFPTQRDQTLTNGFWEFEDLTEGYYEVNVGDVGFKPANIDANSKIDDDASEAADEEHTKLVKGERDLASGNNFYIYDGGKDDDDGLASLVVMGTQNVDDGEEALTGVTVPSAQDAGGSDAMGSIDAITWASESITVIPTIAAGATYTVTIPGTTAPMVVGSGTGASTDDGVEFKLPDYGTGHAMEGTDRETMVTVTVTAANGYHDHEYSFDVSLAAPAGDELAGLSVRQGTFSGTLVDLDPGFAVAEDEYRVSIPATVMSLHLAATLDDIKQVGMTVVTHNNDGTTSEIDRAPSRTGDPVTLHRFDVPVGGTTIARSIVLTVISEDEEEREIEISINRDDTPTTPATLTGLTLSGVDGLTFVSSTTEYTASVANAVDKTTVTATAATDATAVITPADADPNTAGHQVNLAEGATTIMIAVTGAGMTDNTYTVTVTRARAGANTPATGQPMITGMAKVGETLTADASGVNDADGMANATLAYQWSSNDGSADSDISGATSVTYVPVAGDVGNTLKVTVSFTDDADNGEMVTSDATEAVAAGDDVPSAPQRLAVSSRASGQLTVSWRPPADEGALVIAGYEYRVAPTQTWTLVEDAAAARDVTITAGLTDGRSATVYVRAFGTGADGPVPGAEGSVSGTPRPGVTVGTPTDDNIDEQDDAESTDVNENETTVSIDLSLSFGNTRVSLMLYAGNVVADPEEESTKATIVGGSMITFGPGELSRDVTIRAVDNSADDDPNPTFRVAAKVAETEAESRAAVVSTAVTIMDDDFKPATVTTVDAAAGDTKLTVTWDDLADHDPGVNDDASKGNGTGFSYQYRYKITTATDASAWSAWAPAAHSESGIEIASLINGVGYTVEVRGKSSAGDGTAGTDDGTPEVPSG